MCQVSVGKRCKSKFRHWFLFTLPHPSLTLTIDLLLWGAGRFISGSWELGVKFPVKKILLCLRRNRVLGTSAVFDFFKTASHFHNNPLTRVSKFLVLLSILTTRMTVTTFRNNQMLNLPAEIFKKLVLNCMLWPLSLFGSQALKLAGRLLTGLDQN